MKNILTSILIMTLFGCATYAALNDDAARERLLNSPEVKEIMEAEEADLGEKWCRLDVAARLLIRFELESSGINLPLTCTEIKS